MHATTDSRTDLLRALGVLAEPPGPHQQHLAGLLGLPAPTGSQWTETFVLQLVPHASIYLGPQGMLGGPAADRIAGFWRALHRPIPADPDHLTALLGLYASLIEAQATEPPGPRQALLGNARAALLHEHLLSWLVPYTRAVAEIAPAPYTAWAGLLRETLSREATEFGAPEQLPVHLRAAPPLPIAPDSLDAVIDSLLCPVVSGMILTRGHLARIAHHRGLALRLGERRHVLRALIDQDSTTVLDALADQADSWTAHHRTDRPLAGPIARHWAERAAATAQLLRTGAHDHHATTKQEASR